MKENIAYVVEKSDYFSQLVTLNFNKEKKFQTIIGGIISLIIYGVSLAVIVISSMQLIGRLNPKTTYTQKNLGQTPIINLNSSEYLFITYFQSPNGGYYQLYDPTIFSLNFYQFLSYRYPNGTQITSKTLLPWVNCTNYLPIFQAENVELYFTSNNLQLSLCLDMSLNLTIGGDFSGEFNSNFYVSLDVCRNSTESNIICKPYDEIYNNMYNGYLNLIYFDKNVDVNKYEKPFLTYVNSFFQKVDPKLYKKIDLYFQLANVTSDVGLIFQELRTESTLLLERYTEDVITTSPKSKVMNVYINISKNSSSYTRLYMKFQELAALFGGIFNAMALVGFIITYPIAQFKMYEHMFNSLFIQRGQVLKKNAIIKTNKEIKKLQVLLEGNNQLSTRRLNSEEKYASQFNPVVQKKTFNFNKSSNSKSEQKTNKEFVLKHIDNKIEDFQAKTSKKFSYEVHDVIYMYLCCYKKSQVKRNIFQTGFKKLLKYLDLLEVMKTHQQFNQLKDVIFTKNQAKLFDYYNKPEMNKDTIVNQKKTESTYVELYKSFMKASEKTDNRINRKLLRNFDENLKEIFKNFDPINNLASKLDKNLESEKS